MRKIKDIMLAVLIIGLLISATVPASWVKQIFPFGVQIKGDLQVDSTLYLIERTASTSDSVLVLEDGVVGYNTSASGSGDTALWGKATTQLYTLPQTTTLGLGTDNPQTRLHLVDSVGSLGINPYLYTTTADAYPQLNFAKFNGTPSSFAAIATSTDMGGVNFAGAYNTSSTSQGASIRVQSMEAWDSGNRGTRMVFGTVTEGETAITNVLYVESEKIGVMNSSPDSVLDVTGGGNFTTDILVGGGWANYTPTVTFTGGTPSASTLKTARYEVTNNRVNFVITIEGDNDSGSPLTAVEFTLPFTPTDINAYVPVSGLYNTLKAVPTTVGLALIDAYDNTAGSRTLSMVVAIPNTEPYTVSVSGFYEITTK